MMTESEWLDLKRYLDEHDIEYKTQIDCIAGPMSSFTVYLPPVTVYHNTKDEFETKYPEVASAMEELWNTVKGVMKS